MAHGADFRILVAGASGLIGYFVASDLARRGYVVAAVARRFEPAQRFGLGSATPVEMPIMGSTPRRSQL